MKCINVKNEIIPDNLNNRLVVKELLALELEALLNSAIKVLKSIYNDNSFIIDINNNNNQLKLMLNYIFNIEDNTSFDYLVNHLNKMITRLTSDFLDAVTKAELVDVAARIIILQRYISIVL